MLLALLAATTLLSPEPTRIVVFEGACGNDPSLCPVYTMEINAEDEFQLCTHGSANAHGYTSGRLDRGVFSVTASSLIESDILNREAVVAYSPMTEECTAPRAGYSTFIVYAEFETADPLDFAIYWGCAISQTLGGPLAEELGDTHLAALEFAMTWRTQIGYLDRIQTAQTREALRTAPAHPFGLEYSPQDCPITFPGHTP